MKVVPVIDVLNGIAVHGIRGKRKQYLPLDSILVDSTNPIEIALAFESLGFNTLYLADLDAIMGKLPNFELYRKIVNQTNLMLMVDAGINNLIKANQLIINKIHKIVVGTETLTNLDFVRDAVRILGSDKVIVSIDLKNENVVGVSNKIKSMDPVTLLKRIIDLAVKEIIVLDLDRVGTEFGINLDLLKRIIRINRIDVFIGGGIRNLRELKELRELGVSGALVATVLHNGKLRISDLKKTDFL